MIAETFISAELLRPMRTQKFRDHEPARSAIAKSGAGRLRRAIAPQCDWLITERVASRSSVCPQDR
jgi:hypothetical protein